jgi:toxin FitB
VLDLVDSSAWLEYFADGGSASQFAVAIESSEGLLVPTIVLYEVFKRILAQWGEAEALSKYALMAEAEVVPLSAPLAIEAARLSLVTHLPMADSVILATARAYGATVWTQDQHFSGLESVRYIPRG